MVEMSDISAHARLDERHWSEMDYGRNVGLLRRRTFLWECLSEMDYGRNVGLKIRKHYVNSGSLKWTMVEMSD